MSEIIEKVKSVRWQHLLFLVLIAAVVAGTEGCKTSGKLSKKERKAQIEAAKRELTAIINGTTTKTLEEQDKYINDIANKNYNDAELNGLLVQATQKLKKAWADREKQKQERVDKSVAELLDLLANKDNKSADQLEAELNAIKARNKDVNDDQLNDLYARVEKKINNMRSGGTVNVPIKTKLENNFDAIATAAQNGNLSQANTIIKNTLPMFASETTPVLIIIYKGDASKGEKNDYDEPTNITRYLNYCKDQKEAKHNIDAMQVDAGGKITILELIKK